MSTQEKQISQQINLQPAANVDYISEKKASSQTTKPASWDAYEVWRRMIKEPREQRKSDKR